MVRGLILSGRYRGTIGRIWRCCDGYTPLSCFTSPHKLPAVQIPKLSSPQRSMLHSRIDTQYAARKSERKIRCEGRSEPGWDSYRGKIYDWQYYVQRTPLKAHKRGRVVRSAPVPLKLAFPDKLTDSQPAGTIVLELFQLGPSPYH